MPGTIDDSMPLRHDIKVVSWNACNRLGKSFDTEPEQYAHAQGFVQLAETTNGSIILESTSESLDKLDEDDEEDEESTPTLATLGGGDIRHLGFRVNYNSERRR